MGIWGHGDTGGHRNWLKPQGYLGDTYWGHPIPWGHLCPGVTSGHVPPPSPRGELGGPHPLTVSPVGHRHSEGTRGGPGASVTLLGGPGVCGGESWGCGVQAVLGMGIGVQDWALGLWVWNGG